MIELSKEEKTQVIQDCQNLEELLEAFDKIGAVEGSHKQYTPERLKEKIKQLEAYCVPDIPFEAVRWSIITRSHGIRAKCMELFFYKKKKLE